MREYNLGGYENTEQSDGAAASKEKEHESADQGVLRHSSGQLPGRRRMMRFNNRHNFFFLNIAEAIHCLILPPARLEIIGIHVALF